MPPSKKTTNKTNVSARLDLLIISPANPLNINVTKGKFMDSVASFSLSSFAITL